MKHKQLKYHNQGFTLIELLVVISIITFLFSLALTGFVNARRKARDAIVKQNVKALDSALRLYGADNADYPTTTNESNLNSRGLDYCTDIASCSTLASFSSLVNYGYLNQIPAPPKGNNYGFWYVHRISGHNINPQFYNTCVDIGNNCGYSGGYDFGSCFAASGDIPMDATAKAVLIFGLENGPSEDYKKGSGIYSQGNVVCLY